MSEREVCGCGDPDCAWPDWQEETDGQRRDIELPVSDPKTWDDYAKRWDDVAQPGRPAVTDQYKIGWYDGYHASRDEPMFLG